MKVNISIYKFLLLILFISFSGCETLDLDQLEDPSAVSTKLLDPNYAFNFVQLELPSFVNSANRFTQRVTRQMAMTGGNTYETAFTPNDFNDNWKTGYNMLAAIKKMEPKAIEKEYYYIIGASKVIRCYVLLTMTDMYGDIPVKEALMGNANLYPKFDKDSEVYKQILLELDEAIATLSRSGGSIDSQFNDLYYSSKASWITLAKTLKLKMYFTARLAGTEIGVPDIKAAMDAIISANDYIDTPSEDFVFKYGTSRTNPNTRHPDYNDQYELGGGAYLANYMMWTMTTEKEFTQNPTAATVNSTLNPSAAQIDPRVTYYFYKQKTDPQTLDRFALPSLTRPSHYDDAKYNSFYKSNIKACYSLSAWTSGASLPTANGGYLGRDHGNNTGIPPDADLRTVVGVYPAGGKYGFDGNTVQRSGIDGAKGAGIMPILLSSWVHFMKAEAILTNVMSGDARAEFLLGVNQSLDKVTAGIGSGVDKYPVLTADQTDDLISNKTVYGLYIAGLYDSYNTTKKLELIIKEYFIAAWGNGIEPYNNYRRTGYPSNFQPTLEPVSGDYFYRAYYPLSSINNNPNAPSNTRTKRIFWDKANLNLH